MNRNTPPGSIDRGRRDWLRTFMGVGLGASMTSLPSLLHGADKNLMAGIAEAFDDEMERLMRERDIPGGALAVFRERTLLHARGYGTTRHGGAELVTRHSLFRVASVSKPVTAAAIHHLVAGGRLHLDSPVLDWILHRDGLAGSEVKDPRWRQITIDHLLHHTGGWDRDLAGDPMFQSRQIGQALGLKTQPGPRDVVAYMLGQPLQWDPGRRFAYSNLGYCLLGRVIEAVTGESYESFVRRAVLEPAGAKTMRLGRTLLRHRAAGEVFYHHPRTKRVEGGVESWEREGEEEAEGVMVELGRGRVAWPYGGFCLEWMDAHGGWLASVTDLARWVGSGWDGGSWGWVMEPPAPPVSREPGGEVSDAYYGRGWMVRPVGGGRGANLWHNGSLPGTWALLVRRWDGVGWAVLWNQRTEGERGRKWSDEALDGAMHRAAARAGL